MAGDRAWRSVRALRLSDNEVKRQLGRKTEGRMTKNPKTSGYGRMEET